MKSNRSTMAPMAMSSRVPRSSSTAEASRFEVARLSGKTPPCNLTSQLGSLPPKNRAYEWSRWEWMWWRDDGTLATGRSAGTERFADWCRRSWSECLPDEIECTFSASTIVISRNYCSFYECTFRIGIEFALRIYQNTGPFRAKVPFSFWKHRIIRE